MLKRILATLGIGQAAKSSATAVGFYKPYSEHHVNFLYNLLFCDDISLFKKEDAKSDGVWRTLFADPPDKAALRKVAGDEGNEGRVRALAYNRLRALGESVPSKKILEVIVEVPLQQGLDALAAFAEGGARYLNHSGKAAIFEGKGNPVEALAKELVAVGQPLVNQIGPWDQQRLPPPRAGHVRITFLVSDGLYFGEGPMDALEQDPLAAPVLAKATQLLLRAVELGTRQARTST